METLNHLPKVTQLISSRVGEENPGILALALMLLSTMPDCFPLRDELFVCLFFSALLLVESRSDAFPQS